MGKNSVLYNKAYHERKREVLLKELGGKCEVCGVKQDLIIHRIYSPYNFRSRRIETQTTFDGDIGKVNKFTPVSAAVAKKRAKILASNPDNMVLLCFKCYSELRRIHGRKKRIGRVQIEKFKGLY
jgi:hypothetical protein